MSGILQALIASTGFSVVSNNYDSSVITVATQPQVQFLSDGTTTTRDSGGAIVAGPNWGNPVTTGIGANYYLQVVFASGNATGIANEASSPIDISATRGIRRTAATPSNALTSNFTYQIATDIGMTNIVGSGTLLLLSDRT